MVFAFDIDHLLFHPVAITPPPFNDFYALLLYLAVTEVTVQD
jgi:hypothetical protein